MSVVVWRRVFMLQSASRSPSPSRPWETLVPPGCRAADPSPPPSLGILLRGQTVVAIGGSAGGHSRNEVGIEAAAGVLGRQALAELPELLSGVCVIGLRVGTPLRGAVEVAPGDAREGRVGDQPLGGVGAGRNRVQALTP